MSIWGVSRVGGGTLKLCQNICLLNVHWYQKKTGILAIEPFKKVIFGNRIWGVLKELPQKVSEDEIAFAAQQLYTKIGF